MRRLFLCTAQRAGTAPEQAHGAASPHAALADAEPDERAGYERYVVRRYPRPAPEPAEPLSFHTLAARAAARLGDGVSLRAALDRNRRVHLSFSRVADDSPHERTRAAALQTLLTTDVVKLEEEDIARLSRAEQQRILEAPSGEEAERELQTRVGRAQWRAR